MNSERLKRFALTALIASSPTIIGCQPPKLADGCFRYEGTYDPNPQSGNKDGQFRLETIACPGTEVDPKSIFPCPVEGVKHFYGFRESPGGEIKGYLVEGTCILKQ